ncbi:MAG TPA: uracil-DNA glycosylase family protein [Burkholderiales bacterium]|nr:uracil-DNA glycosylase family protein [Burkholderiales bacterium]
MSLVQAARALRDEVEALAFAPPVAYVYDPLEYAWAPHLEYLERYGKRRREVVLLGMNPGPFGMAQTGVPFGDVGMVRDWLGIEAPVGHPAREHPKRPVRGFACARGEVSGRRLWGWARARFGTPQRFFARFFVANYCPLAFMQASGRNLTPDKLPRAERERLYAACDRALRACVAQLRPAHVVGIGRFAAERAARALQRSGVKLGSVPHPSPASPAANRGWEALMDGALAGLGILEQGARP